MKLSKRGEYGLRAMIMLASHPQENQAVQISQIARAENIPVKFLEQILRNLKNAVLVNSRMGANGGYYLDHSAAEISLGQIVRVLDGPLAPIHCVSQTAYEPCNCPDEKNCGLRRVMLQVRNAIADILDHQTLAEVVRNLSPEELSNFFRRTT